MNKSREAPASSFDRIDVTFEQHRLCASKQCPGCGQKLEQKQDWVGLPAGVKFDPTDQELMEHLEAKVMSGDSRPPHPLIDEFIATIEGEDGICYTHPEKLPGVTKDGLSKHFFHRPSKAYTTGTRKRRKIQTECDLQGSETRWHKTGKTRPVMVNGKQKGCKKILVLYTNFRKNKKPQKTNWVMHQYHLGQLEEEKEGELVVSKIFYQTQPRQCNWGDKNAAINDGAEQRRRSAGTASGSSSKEADRIEEQTKVRLGFNAAGFPQMKPDQFSFGPFRKSFDEVGIGEASQAGEASSRACEEQQHQRPQHVTHEQQVATAAFHMTTPSNPCTIITPPPLLQTSIVLDDPYQHVSRMIHQGGRFQVRTHTKNGDVLLRKLCQSRFQSLDHLGILSWRKDELEQQQHAQQKMAGRSSGLEELIMGCTSADTKGESSMGNPQEAEWLKYSFWTDPDNPDHHG